MALFPAKKKKRNSLGVLTLWRLSSLKHIAMPPAVATSYTQIIVVDIADYSYIYPTV